MEDARDISGSQILGSPSCASYNTEFERQGSSILHSPSTQHLPLPQQALSGLAGCREGTLRSFSVFPCNCDTLFLEESHSRGMQSGERAGSNLQHLVQALVPWFAGFIRAGAGNVNKDEHLETGWKADAAVEL